MENIVTLDDLKKVLFLQKVITSQAKNELLAIASDHVFDPNGNIEQQAEYFIEKEKELLGKYAKYPTFTEFQFTPSLSSGIKWGATFGVTLLVGELICEQLKVAYPSFNSIIRKLFIVLLSELDNPQHDYLIDSLEKHLTFQITAEDNQEIKPEQQKIIVHNLVNKFTETAVILSEAYGIVNVEERGVTITSTGRRVLMHLIDAMKFIDELTKAHTKFQSVE